jgi:hypothetical protein
MKRLFLLQITLTLPFLALIVAAVLLGERLSRTPAMLRQSCAMPCWNGIEPDEMTIDAANQIMFSQGYEPQNSGGERINYVPGEEDRRRCTVRISHNEAIVTEMRLSNCPNLRLGDVLAAWGAPDTILHNSMTLSFHRGMARIRLVSNDDCEYPLSPYTEVQFIRFARTPGLMPNEVHWHGFMPAWSYKELSPNTIPLSC